MTLSVSHIPQHIARLFTEAIANQTVTTADRYCLMAALLDRELDRDDRQAVDAILRAVAQSQT